MAESQQLEADKSTKPYALPLPLPQSYCSLHIPTGNKMLLQLQGDDKQLPCVTECSSELYWLETMQMVHKH